MRALEDILCESSSRHKHLCPRQVLGARMALYAAEILALDLPRKDKRLLVTTEVDGCAVDGLIAATGCRAGSRTLRIVDFGKVAATFTDTCTGTTIRIVPARDARALAREYAPRARNRWDAMLAGYQVMPFGRLFQTQPVRLNMTISQIISKPGKQTFCYVCGEEVINGREVILDGRIICRACAGESYYQKIEPFCAATQTFPS